MRRAFVVLLAVAMLVLSGCAGHNELGLSLTEGEVGEQNYIYYTDSLVVYVVSGVMTVELDGESKLLEVALHDGEVTVDSILAMAEEDAEDGDITRTDYPDGSVEYAYDNFNLIRLNTYSGSRDIYFVPKDMNYYDVSN